MPGCASVPGILLLSAAFVLLLLVTFSTPSLKQIYYLSATIGGTGTDAGRRITFGTLGYCLGNRCSPLKLGYRLTDANQLFGTEIIPEQYTSTLIKGLTYTLILQPAAAALTLIALLFALLSACPGCACGACCGSFFTGLAASVTLVAFALDLALFVIAKKRIDAISGASATLGNGLWLVAAAWGCLVIGAILVCCGACCGGGGGGSGRNNNNGNHKKGDSWGNTGPPPPSSSQPANDGYGSHMRMDALAAERDCKNRQAAYERGRSDGGGALPQFVEYVTEHEEVAPLTNDYDGRHGHGQGYSAAAGGPPVVQGYYDAPAQPQPHHRQQSSTAGYPATYVPGVGQGYGERRGGGHGAYGAGGNGDGAQEFYTPGEGPQPFREGSYIDGGAGGGGYHEAGYGGAALAVGAGAGAAAGYAVGGGHAQGPSQTHYDQGRGAAAGAGNYTQEYDHTHSQDPYYQPQQQHQEPGLASGYGGYDTYHNYHDPAQQQQAGSSSAAAGQGYHPNEYEIAGAPVPPPAAHGLPEMPMPVPQAQPQASEKDQMRAHYAAQDSQPQPASHHQQEAEPHLEAVARLESLADRMSSAYPDSSVGGGAQTAFGPYYDDGSGGASGGPSAGGGPPAYLTGYHQQGQGQGPYGHQ
ncbi:unnamed protein product [Tilletia laevis]|uniref:Pali-domain-containing protein n=3 Tax=Tilletia TaxID=13289 RepID=A0A8X7MZL8_9BASI|nr:hypothetical protein CF336_g6676 [Tilletia laevis]KAE8204175.1 hypothetical protein CF328_g1226 [Tilletia controversa]KAE8256850.1 hypothetical protein A4X03_0g4992 [Tilletia caries]KAE8199692.1 hypothetical protein CF335_g4114 [Tilletia laevis]KAE8253506.1 hypothetical protein A4X06_0g1406 [Tilletia controversa]